MAKFSAVGRYFMLENKATGTVLNVKEGLALPKTTVVVWKEHKGENQVWYMDPLTETIRNRHNHLCLDVDASARLIINIYEKDDPKQQWRYNDSNDTIENIFNPVQVLEVPGGTKAAMGSEVFPSEFHGGNTQKWILKGLPIQYFLIRSELCDKVVDILGAKSSPGSRVILWDQKSKSNDSQLWFEDKYGNIRSKLNAKLVFDGTGHSVVTGEHKMEKSQARIFWVISGNKIVNKENHNEVIGVKDRLTIDGAELSVVLYRGEASHHWSFEYI